MNTLSKRERVEAALKGEPVDRVPVSAWRHFIPAERKVDDLAAASLAHFHEFDLDWLKVNPRATYYAEVWGARYDLDDYARVYPRLKKSPIEKPEDLKKIEPVTPTGGVFDEQLKLIQQIKAGIGGAHFIQTVFSPLSVLAFLAAGQPEPHTAAGAVQAQMDGAARMIRENPQGAHTALGAIATTLAGYASAVVEAGASGLFFAITKLARRGVLTEQEYREFGLPYDLQVLAAVQSAPFNLLHICGPAVYFNLVPAYPVQAVNWAAVGQENPTVGQAQKRVPQAVMGGVDEDGALQTGTPAQVIAEAQQAIRETGGRHFLLSPGCGVGMDAPAANLHALRQAAGLPL